MNDKYIVIFDGHNITSASLKRKVMNGKKENIAGINRFMEKLNFIDNMYSIGKIVVAFDTHNSRNKRTLLYSDYKGQRKTSEEYKIDRDLNMERIKEYSKYLPLHYIEADECEADDVISYLTTDLYKNYKTIIVSTDQDYNQLLDSNTIIFNPTLNKIITISDLDYHPKNIILIKAIVGDSSDNIKGVKGVGQKTLLKNVPELFTQSEINLQSLIKICKSREDINPICRKLLSNMYNIIKFYSKIINLHDNEYFISNEEKERINNILNVKHIFKPEKLYKSIKENKDSFTLLKSKFNLFNTIY